MCLTHDRLTQNWNEYFHPSAAYQEIPAVRREQFGREGDDGIVLRAVHRHRRHRDRVGRGRARPTPQTVTSAPAVRTACSSTCATTRATLGCTQIGFSESPESFVRRATGTSSTTGSATGTPGKRKKSMTSSHKPSSRRLASTMYVELSCECGSVTSARRSSACPRITWMDPRRSCARSATATGGSGRHGVASATAASRFIASTCLARLGARLSR